MLKKCIALGLILLCFAACSDEEEDWTAGKAYLKVVNNSTKYVDGLIYADKTYSYDVLSKSSESYSIQVGEGLLDYTNVLITANIHADNTSSSGHIASDKEKIRMKEGHSYEYVIPYDGRSRVYELKVESTKSKPSITSP